jgi:hypothetical protein
VFGDFAIEANYGQVVLVDDDAGYFITLWDEEEDHSGATAKQVFAFVCGLAADGVAVVEFSYRWSSRFGKVVADPRYTKCPPTVCDDE